jgi:hypothetical protein
MFNDTARSLFVLSPRLRQFVFFGCLSAQLQVAECSPFVNAFCFSSLSTRWLPVFMSEAIIVLMVVVGKAKEEKNNFTVAFFFFRFSFSFQCSHCRSYSHSNGVSQMLHRPGQKSEGNCRTWWIKWTNIFLLATTLRIRWNPLSSTV